MIQSSHDVTLKNVRGSSRGVQALLGIVTTMNKHRLIKTICAQSLHML